MDNHIFRSALSGFNRQDVMEYIEKTQKEGESAAAALTGWGGLSVHCQAMSVAGSAGLSFRWHWLGKAVQAAVSFLLAAGVQYALSIGL